MAGAGRIRYMNEYRAGLSTADLWERTVLVWRLGFLHVQGEGYQVDLRLLRAIQESYSGSRRNRVRW